MKYKKNNILETYPELVKEWDYDKNIFGPEEISFGSIKKSIGNVLRDMNGLQRLTHEQIIILDVLFALGDCQY